MPTRQDLACGEMGERSRREEKVKKLTIGLASVDWLMKRYVPLGLACLVHLTVNSLKQAVFRRRALRDGGSCHAHWHLCPTRNRHSALLQDRKASESISSAMPMTMVSIIVSGSTCQDPEMQTYSSVLQPAHTPL